MGCAAAATVAAAAAAAAHCHGGTGICRGVVYGECADMCLSTVAHGVCLLLQMVYAAREYPVLASFSPTALLLSYGHTLSLPLLPSPLVCSVSHRCAPATLPSSPSPWTTWTRRCRGCSASVPPWMAPSGTTCTVPLRRCGHPMVTWSASSRGPTCRGGGGRRLPRRLRRHGRALDGSREMGGQSARVFKPPVPSFSCLDTGGTGG